MVQILASLLSHFCLGLLISQLDNYSQVAYTILGWRILHEQDFFLFNVWYVSFSFGICLYLLQSEANSTCFTSLFSLPLGLLIKDKCFYWSDTYSLLWKKTVLWLKKEKKKIKCLKSFWKALLGKTGHSVCVENLLQHYLKILHVIATGD